MKKHCHACDEEISKSAQVCHHCSSNQRKFIYYVNSLASSGTFLISVISLAISFAALYFSRSPEPASPRLVVQMDRFTRTGFSFFMANLGQLPTAVRDFDLEVSLKEGEGTRTVKAGFSLPPSQIAPGENQLVQVEYSDFVPDYTRWTASEDLRDKPFDLQFLYAASSLGSNLHCEVSVYFTSRRYFPSNIDGASASVNGTCSEAMEWFAKNIGPLKDKEKSK